MYKRIIKTVLILQLLSLTLQTDQPIPDFEACLETCKSTRTSDFAAMSGTNTQEEIDAVGQQWADISKCYWDTGSIEGYTPDSGVTFPSDCQSIADMAPEYKLSLFGILAYLDYFSKCYEECNPDEWNYADYNPNVGFIDCTGECLYDNMVNISVIPDQNEAFRDCQNVCKNTKNEAIAGLDQAVKDQIFNQELEFKECTIKRGTDECDNYLDENNSTDIYLDGHENPETVDAYIACRDSCYTKENVDTTFHEVLKTYYACDDVCFDTFEALVPRPDENEKQTGFGNILKAVQLIFGIIFVIASV